MKPSRNNPETVRPEQLAAYEDGELNAVTRLEIEDWLAHHPAATAEVNAQRRLARLLQTTRPREPDQAAWSRTLAGIETALAASPPPKSSWLGLTRWLSAAAAVLLFLVLERGQRDQPTSPVEPFPVSSMEDVEIISVHAADEKMLVVGLPPVQDPLDLVDVGDIVVKNIQPDIDGMVPYVHQPAAGTSPMIVAPLHGAPTK